MFVNDGNDLESEGKINDARKRWNACCSGQEEILFKM